MARAGCVPRCRSRATRWAADAFAGCSKRAACAPSSPAHSCPALQTRTLRCAPRPTACWASQPHCPEPGVGGRHHVPAPPGRRLALPGRVAGPLLAQNCALERARDHARGPGPRSAKPGPGRAPARSRARYPLRLGQPVHRHPLQRLGLETRCAAKYEPARQLLRQRLRRTFWSRSKDELRDGGSFPGLAEAKLKFSHHIACYNAERRRSTLGYQSHNHFETHLQTTSQICPS